MFGNMFGGEREGLSKRAKMIIVIAAGGWLVVACLVGTALSMLVPAIGETVRGATGIDPSGWITAFYIINWLFTCLVWFFIQAVFTLVLGMFAWFFGRPFLRRFL